MDQTRVDAEGLVEELLASTDLKPVEQEECKLLISHCITKLALGALCPAIQISIV